MPQRLLLKPSVLLLSGVPLSGKSYLAKQLATCSNAEHLDVDVVRREIISGDLNIPALESNQELDIMMKVYEELCQRAETVVLSGIPVVIAGTFSKAEFKRPAEKLSEKLSLQQIPVKAFLLTVSDEEARKRIEKRNSQGSFSNIDSVDKYNWAKSIFSKIEFVPTVEIDTSQENYMEILLQHLEDLKS